jgi:hypothetical protein
MLEQHAYVLGTSICRHYVQGGRVVIKPCIYVRTMARAARVRHRPSGLLLQVNNNSVLDWEAGCLRAPILLVARSLDTLNMHVLGRLGCTVSVLLNAWS